MTPDQPDNDEYNEQPIHDILGIGHTKLGFFQEWQNNLLQLQRAHAESERQRLSIAAILESITDVMMVLDTDMRILSANQVFEELFPSREYRNEHCYTFFTNSDTPCPECPAFRSLRHNGVFRESAIFQLNGNNLRFDMVASPMPHPSGSGKAVLMLKRDVTREKKLQAQMYMAEKMASIGVLAAGVAHEINNPLTAINGFAEGIRRRLPCIQPNTPPEVYEDLDEYVLTILNECIRCRDIVQALTNFSRPLPSRTPVSLGALVNEVLTLLRHTLKSYRRVLFCLDLDPGVPEIWADDTQVRQVLLNLVTNALDALGSPDDKDYREGSITIRTRTSGSFVILEVEDTGTGISPQHLRTAFEPFFTTKPKGLGLGLSICYNVVTAHGGDIQLARTKNRTTRATVRLPLREQTSEQNTPSYAD